MSTMEGLYWLCAVLVKEGLCYVSPGSAEALGFVR